jgi:hypothetical protein
MLRTRRVRPGPKAIHSIASGGLPAIVMAPVHCSEASGALF